MQHNSKRHTSACVYNVKKIVYTGGFQPGGLSKLSWGLQDDLKLIIYIYIKITDLIKKLKKLNLIFFLNNYCFY